MMRPKHLKVEEPLQGISKFETKHLHNAGVVFKRN